MKLVEYGTLSVYKVPKREGVGHFSPTICGWYYVSANKAIALKNPFKQFEVESSHCINLNKSKLYMVGDVSNLNVIANIMGREIDSFPFYVLRAPFGGQKQIYSSLKEGALEVL